MTPNDAVNIEVDILAKYVESLIASQKASAASHVTVTELIEEGF
jgi:riboflavin synthase alpha subunit